MTTCPHGHPPGCDRCFEEAYVRAFRTHRSRGEVQLDVPRIRALVAALDDRQREAFLLLVDGGLTQEKIGEHMGISQPRVSQLLKQAKSELRSHLARKDSVKPSELKKA